MSLDRYTVNDSLFQIFVNANLYQFTEQTVIEYTYDNVNSSSKAQPLGNQNIVIYMYQTCLIRYHTVQFI